MRNKTTVFLLLVAGTLAATGGLLARGEDPELKTKTAIRPRPQADRPAHSAAPGWAWLMAPQELCVGQQFGQASEAGIVSGYSHVDADGGGFRIFFVQAGPTPRVDTPAYRLVVFDAAGERYLPKRVQAGGMGNRDTQISNATFALEKDILPPGKAVSVAAEQILPKAK